MGRLIEEADVPARKGKQWYEWEAFLSEENIPEGKAMILDRKNGDPSAESVRAHIKIKQLTDRWSVYVVDKGREKEIAYVIHSYGRTNNP